MKMMLKPPSTVFEDGMTKNLDPRKCDCGKGRYCPLWTHDWLAYVKAVDPDYDFNAFED